MSFITSSLPDKQKGAALLAFMLVLILGSSYMLLQGINENIRRHQAPQQNAEVLQMAKDALLGYAVTYPDNVNPSFGPGFLPCPDTKHYSHVQFGRADTYCNNPFGANVGRLPFRTLGLDKLRDATGESLWYVLSQSHANNPKSPIMNSEQPGGSLIVDAVDDIVAIIIAPGAPLENQVGRNDPAGFNEVSNYLDGINAAGDAVFTRSGECDNPSMPKAECFNDQVIYITRSELMTLVEKRVLGDAAQSIRNYKATHDAYPWLSEFESPEISDYKARVGVSRGHVAYHWSEDEPGESNRNPFMTPIRWAWQTVPNTATEYWDGTVTTDCLRNVDCDDGLFPQISAVEILEPQVECVWIDRDTIDCGPSDWVTMPIQQDVPCNVMALDGTVCEGTCARQYQVTLPEYVGTSTVIDPAMDSLRMRDVRVDGSLPVQGRAIEIEDMCTDAANNTRIIGEGFINFTPTTTGTLSTSIQYDLNADDAELPIWFVENNWHHLVYVAYASSEDLPGSDDDSVNMACVPGNDCIVIENDTLPNDNIRSIALIAGAPVVKPGSDGAQQERPGSALDDYFEYENSDDSDDVFRTSRWDPDVPGVNDQIRVIERVEDG